MNSKKQKDWDEVYKEMVNAQIKENSKNFPNAEPVEEVKAKKKNKTAKKDSKYFRGAYWGNLDYAGSDVTDMAGGE
jgi:hypothetical protein